MVLLYCTVFRFFLFSLLLFFSAVRSSKYFSLFLNSFVHSIIQMLDYPVLRIFDFWIIRSFGSMVMRLFDHSAIRLFGYLVIRFFDYSVLPTFRPFVFSIIRLFDYSIIRLFHFSVLRFFGCLIVRFFGYPIIRLFFIFYLLKTLIDKQKTVAEMAATRQIQEKQKARRMAADAVQQVKLMISFRF